MKIVPFESWHADRVVLQPMQCDVEAEPIPPGSTAFTGIEGDKIVFCAGASFMEGVWVIWGMLSEDAGRYMLRITRLYRKIIAELDGPAGALVRPDFPQAKRLAELAGLTFAMHDPSALVNGADVYVKVLKCNS